MAKFTEFISNLFRSPQSDEEEYYDDEPSPNENNINRTADISTDTSIFPKAETRITPINLSEETELLRPTSKTEVAIPYWLED